MAIAVTRHASTIPLSDAAQENIKNRVRFTDYLESKVWPLCRQAFRDSMIVASDRAKEELIEKVEEKQMGNCRVLELTPKTYQPREERIILYIHGGAFTLGAPDYQIQIPAPVAHRIGCKVIAVDYPLAPYPKTDDPQTNDPHPAHTAVFSVYQELIKEYSSSKIALLADSAGGSIAFGIALMARDQGMDLPGAVVAYAPWVDMEQQTQSYFNPDRINQTVVLTPACLASARDAAFGLKCNYSPYISSKNGNYEGFSSVAVAIYTAGRDLLKEEGESLAEQLRFSAKCVETFCHEGMWHGFQEHYGMPEAEKSADLAAQFMLYNLG